MIPDEQQAAVALLHGAAGSQPIETHISLVFTGADTVWKLRKAVRLPFLDFVDVEARRRAAIRELELNAPAAPGLYRDLVPIVSNPDGSAGFGAPTQNGDTNERDVVDWVVRMAHVPAQHFLEHLALSGRMTDALLDAVADSVARYHLSLPGVGGIEAADRMRLVALGNAQSALDAGLEPAGVRAWLDLVMNEIGGLADWLDARGAEGFIRRAHGDLHLGNMCLWNGWPVPFDALEFDEAMATIDLGYDLAFLLMDIDHRVGRRQANRVMNRYIAWTGDVGLTRGLPLFLSLRAMVRAHVEAKRARVALARTYLRAADAYLKPVPCMVVATGGLPGAGKSTLARTLAPETGRAPGALILRSDEIRKRLRGAVPEERLPAAAYSEQVSRHVMQTLLDDVRRAARGGHSVIADATFLDPADREQVERSALAARAAFIGLWLEAPLPDLESRLQARVNDASDATVEVLRAAARDARGASEWIAVDARTQDSASAAAREALRKAITS